MPIIRKYSDNVHVLDYDAKMLESLHTTFGSEIKTYTNASIENSGYQNQSFDYLICWGVFDGSKSCAGGIFKNNEVGGKILITGKNCKYDCSDMKLLLQRKLLEGLVIKIYSLDSMKLTLNLTVSPKIYAKI